MILTVNEIAEFVGAANPNDPRPIGQWSIDTRTLPAGALYIALNGDTHDGHNFLQAAAERGATAAAAPCTELPARGGGDSSVSSGAHAAGTFRPGLAPPYTQPVRSCDAKPFLACESTCARACLIHAQVQYFHAREMVSVLLQNDNLM